jgi:large subunit ribosomal protein L16
MKANIFPHLGVTGKSLERMGSGYGAIKHWVAVAKKLRVVFELRGLPKKIAYQALIAASYKLPGQYKVVEKDSGEISE